MRYRVRQIVLPEPAHAKWAVEEQIWIWDSLFPRRIWVTMGYFETHFLAEEYLYWYRAGFPHVYDSR